MSTSGVAFPSFLLSIPSRLAETMREDGAVTVGQHGLSRFRGVISDRSTSIRRLLARITGVCASINITMLRSGLYTKPSDFSVAPILNVPHNAS